MRLANLAGRLVLVDGDRALDVERSSGGTFSSDPQSVFERWDEFCAWAQAAHVADGERFDPRRLGSPVPSPRQLFAVGLNYRDHVDEVGLAHDVPVVFTKYVSSIAGPYEDIPHPGGEVDWEVELVAVIGRGGHGIREEDAWSHVAGLTIGQDISERITQHVGVTPQFSLGKSFPKFAPMGPVLVTPDELANPDDVALETVVNGETVQSSRTSLMTSSVSRLIVQLSSITTLLPGDAIFTGTPSGVGLGMVPPRYLNVGDELVTRIEGVGELRNRIVAGQAVA
ncbi:fumarylacetoacetate hydrolase family protein [Microbacterium immunditiarum]|uniref:2-keto-4-pentenoate hydratase/2-oxohepta-3-ene-1,7-dioic acid hydratase in catechol pathway n=1 Tax=Microbacterium immunditiarum TaxID=337480 RepID=A0A7Y9GL16_9MICO|nr:fumarylacetoacetate hydrolase family protein [Microbacterium immunditiarum]NYE18404.1 2-keto-4-pentenoate hydratase/2-oxohepta-3-ene-1,7-dioic acid hydratase in catechol pathway [Microbacterium immunditiarum]